MPESRIPKSNAEPVRVSAADGSVDVLLIANRVGVGGLPRYMAEHAAAMVRLGLRIEVIIPESPGAEFVAERLARIGAEYGFTPGVSVPESIDAVSLWKAIRRHRPSLVRLCTGKAPPDTRLALGAAMTRVPLLESMHLPPSRPAKPMQRAFYALRPKGRYLATNNTVGMHEQALASAPALKDRMVHLSEGVDLTLFRPRSGEREPGPLRLISVSRLDEDHKDIATLIDAAGLLHTRGIGFELTIVGDGKDREALERKAGEAGLLDSGRIRFVGWVEDVPGMLASSDIFVNSTKFESFGRTNIEAAACGVPVVASRVIGCTESVSDGVNGVLVEPGDSNALAEAICTLIEDDGLRARYGADGVRFATGFSMLSHTRRVIELANARLGTGIRLPEDQSPSAIER